MGLHRMELPALVGKKGSSRTMGEKQALAAIGQGRLIALWDQIFGALKQPIAQILLTRNDIADVRNAFSPSVLLRLARKLTLMSTRDCSDLDT